MVEAPENGSIPGDLQLRCVPQPIATADIYPGHSIYDLVVVVLRFRIRRKRASRSDDLRDQGKVSSS